jgi:Right handed beta helix region
MHRETLAINGVTALGDHRGASRAALKGVGMRRLISGLFVLLVGACSGGEGYEDRAGVATLPAAVQSYTVKTLRSYGAVGDGAADDSAALRAAFSGVAGICLDGEGLTYRVVGTIRAEGALCLRNASIRQAMTAIDTRPYIRSDESNAPPRLTAEDVRFYSADPVLTDAQHAALELRNNLRTICVTADNRASVILENVSVMRGSDPSLGSGFNAAAIYIDRATSIQMNAVEVFGYGQGAGISINDSTNVRLNQLNVHDLIWSLSPGDRVFTLAQFRDTWQWNNVPTYQYKPAEKKFAAVRSQERVAGVLILNSSDVVITDSRISELLFPIGGKMLPWQADGISAGYTTSLHVSATSIAHTWEGIDLTGSAGVDQFVLQDLTISNSFSFGIKVVHGSRSGQILNSTISYSGSNGIVFANEVNDFILSGLNVNETGVLYLRDGSTLRPWPNTAGIGIEGTADRLVSPAHVRIVNSEFSNINFPGAAQYGILATPANLIHIVAGNTDAVGMAVEGSKGLSTTSYSYTTVVQEYRNIVGCDGPLPEIMKLWDQAHESVRNPRWTTSQLRSHIRQQKNLGVYRCP